MDINDLIKSIPSVSPPAVPKPFESNEDGDEDDDDDGKRRLVPPKYCSTPQRKRKQGRHIL